MRLTKWIAFFSLAACGAATGRTQESDPMKPRYSKSLYDLTPLPRDTVEKLASKLSPEAYKITQRAGTERAFCGAFFDNHKDGLYVCVVCGLPLFQSSAKFDSGTGWPSFFQPFDPDHVTIGRDDSLGMTRDEIRCARCNSHLGHVFDDGPPPTGQRHCLNSASLRFFETGPKGEMKDPLPPESLPVQTETAYFAGGCFWGIEHWLELGPGVIDAESGYMQGKTDNPTYRDVCNHDTRHAETVKVVFDPARLSFERLLQAFFDIHDPTELDRQGPDEGDQYRSGVWFTSDAQKTTTEKYIAQLTAEKRYASRPIVTKVEKAMKFWSAEEYHQDYVEKTGRACHGSNPWTERASKASGAKH